MARTEIKSGHNVSQYALVYKTRLGTVQGNGMDCRDTSDVGKINALEPTSPPANAAIFFSPNHYLIPR
jgi:hypothetical protein